MCTLCTDILNSNVSYAWLVKYFSGSKTSIQKNYYSIYLENFFFFFCNLEVNLQFLLFLLLPPTARRLPEDLQPACTLSGLLQGGGPGRQSDEGGERWSPDLPPARRHGFRPRHPCPPKKQPRRPEDDKVWQETTAQGIKNAFSSFSSSSFSLISPSSWPPQRHGATAHARRAQ